MGSVFLFLSFSSSCLVSSSSNEVWQLEPACCPQVQEISSVVHKLSCFGVGFSLCLFTGSLFLCLAGFLWSKVSDPSASPLLSAYCDGLLFVYQFCGSIWLWVLLTGSEVELCFLLPALLREWLIICPLWAFLPFHHLFTDSSRRLVHCSSLLLWCTFSNPTPSAVC
jgi:hypothetical protein